MRLVQYCLKKSPTLLRVGVLKDGGVKDCLAGTLVEVLNAENGLETLTSKATETAETHPLETVDLLSPLTKPDKVLCVAMNYKEHCNELKLPLPPQPIVFSKFSSTIVGPFDDVVKPKCAETLDWEVELVVVIGKKAKDVSAVDAFDYVLGYTAGQDLTAREFANSTFNGGQFLLGKSMDTFCPLGPCIVTTDEIPNPYTLNLKTWVNGVLKQNGNTSEMIHRIDTLVEVLSRHMTLYPGDIILTGTPSGVGFFRKPQESLKSGDLLETEIENIGKLANRVV